MISFINNHKGATMKTTTLFLSIVVIAGIFLAGCDKSTEPATDSSVLYEDAAEAISAAVGDESGGATESFADVMIAGGQGSFGTAAPVMDGGDLVTAATPVYDSTTGWWSVSVNRSMDNALVQRSITREYRYQFQKNGTVQRNFITAGDTATTLKFRIVSGTGMLKNQRVSHTLTQLKGAWTSSNLNKDTVTITSGQHLRPFSDRYHQNTEYAPLAHRNIDTDCRECEGTAVSSTAVCFVALQFPSCDQRNDQRKLYCGDHLPARRSL
jgi:hypothetical protein